MPPLASAQAGKREQVKLQNRQAILDAAREVFTELGYDAATVRDIVRRTGLSVGAFYNYFRSKEEVHAALAAEGARRFAPTLKALRAEALEPAAFVRAAIGAYFSFIAEAQQSWLARAPDAPPWASAASPEIQAVFAEVREAITAVIASGVELNGDPDYIAAACIGVAREVGERMLQRRPIDTAAAADFAAAMILGGVRGLPAR